MPTLIHKRVREANFGKNPFAIIKLKSVWVVAGDVQPLEGYCLLLSDPVVPDLNSLDEIARTQYCLDMIRVGDALMKTTDAYRINYETWGNLDPALHTHIMPRYMHEEENKRRMPACKVYDWKSSRPFDLKRDQHFVEKMRELLKQFSV